MVKFKYLFIAFWKEATIGFPNNSPLIFQAHNSKFAFKSSNITVTVATQHPSIVSSVFRIKFRFLLWIKSFIMYCLPCFPELSVPYLSL